MEVIPIDYLLEDEDLDIETVKLIISKYPGFYIFIPKSIYNKQKRKELYVKYKLKYNVSNKYLAEIFKDTFNVKNRQAYRLINETREELINE